jgi:Uma2 family endonuclease
MGPAPPLMTAHEYFKTPETVKPMELAFGALRVADSPSAYHQSIVIELFRALDRHVRERRLGRMWIAPLDVVLSEPRALIVQPDLFFIAHDSDGIVRDRVYGAPGLVIEVLSPNPRIGSTDERVGWFAEFGVRECWLVHADEVEISVLRFADHEVASRARFRRDEPVSSEVLPDFAATLDDIILNDGRPFPFRRA